MGWEREAVLLLIAFYLHSDTLKTRGRFFLALVVYATATATVYIIYDYSQQYVTLTTVLVGAFLVLGMLGVIAVLLAEAHEWAEDYDHKLIIYAVHAGFQAFPDPSGEYTYDFTNPTGDEIFNFFNQPIDHVDKPFYAS